MSQLLTRDLRGKTIVRSDGKRIGTLSTVTMDPKSGALYDLVVDQPSQPPADSSADTGDGRLRIPVRLVKAVNDRIIVNTDATSD